MNIALYAHGGSANHGCEALVRSTIKSLESLGVNNYSILSEAIKEDERYGINTLATILPADDPVSSGISGFLYKLRMRFLKQDSLYYEHIFRNFIKKQENVQFALAIGGDNYCYRGFLDKYSVLNSMYFKSGIPIALWGCSIDPHRLTRRLIEDLNKYKFITARESITYRALREVGLKNVYLIPDTAFRLDSVKKEIPEEFDYQNTVGINLSPLISSYEKNKGITVANYEYLIEYILKHTNLSIALIPHVVWEHNDDRKVLQLLYEKFNHSGRVLLISDRNALLLKGCISSCRFMIAARTHASIAAYSTEVPTLVIGYSVKSVGIAKDLFGTAKNYVLPVNALTRREELAEAFVWLMNNEDSIRNYYTHNLFQYISGLDQIAHLPFYTNC